MLAAGTLKCRCFQIIAASCQDSSTGSRACRAAERLLRTMDMKNFPFTLSKVNDILHEIKLRVPKYQKNITDFFFLEIHIVTLKAFPTRKLR